MEIKKAPATSPSGIKKYKHSSREHDIGHMLFCMKLFNVDYTFKKQEY